MAISRTQSAHNQSSVSGGTLTASLTAIAASSLVVATSSWDTSGGTSGSSITDDLSVTATNRARLAPASSQAVEVWRFANYGGGSRTFTLGNSPAQTFRDMCVIEYAGAATSPDDGTTTNNGSSTTPSSGNLSPAPSVNGTLIVGFACGLTSGAPVFASPFSDVFQETTVVGADTEDYVQPTAATIAATWTASPTGTWNAAAASFKPAVASGGWVGSGTRRAPAKAGPFDQRGMLLSPYQRYSFAPSVVLNAYSFSADPGTYAVTGVASGLLRVATLPALAGSYTLTGAAAKLLLGHAVNAGTATYAINGAIATDLRTLLLNAAGGSYVLSGASATLQAPSPDHPLAVDPTTYALSGANATALRGVRTTVTGAYAISGAPALFLIQRGVPDGLSSYNVNGVAATLIYSGSGPAARVPWQRMGMRMGL